MSCSSRVFLQCVRRWSCHCSQWCGFSCVNSLMQPETCRAHSGAVFVDRAYILRHSSHLYGFCGGISTLPAKWSLSHTGYSCSSPLVWLRWCDLWRLAWQSALWKLFPHWLHRWGFSLEWVCWCCTRCWDSGKHRLHWYGFSPVWAIKCVYVLICLV